MKIIHTGDWHIGKIVNEYHMTRDQEYILDQFLHIVLEEKPNAIIIAGDIYDRSVAPVEAVELLEIHKFIKRSGCNIIQSEKFIKPLSSSCCKTIAKDFALTKTS